VCFEILLEKIGALALQLSPPFELTFFQFSTATERERKGRMDYIVSTFKIEVSAEQLCLCLEFISLQMLPL